MPNPPTASLPALVRPASQLATRSVDWLWPGRLALGKLAILDGDPGLGKSLVTLDLCARLSTGRPFPDGSACPGPSSSIVLNGEDGDEDTIRPRLQMLGADLDRVFLLDRARDDAGQPLCFPAGADILDDALTRTGARLVVIDPIVAFLEPSICDAKDQSIRRALFPLARLAAIHACVILLVRHLNKRFGVRSLYRGSGSIGFLGACRSGWLIARDPLQPERCVLAQLKNNLAPPSPSLAYCLATADSGPPRPPSPPTLSWLGTTSWTADQLLAAPTVAAHATCLDRALDFLADFLAAGPRTSREIWTAAQEQGLSERTIDRAKRKLEVRCLQVGKGATRVSYWLLPHQSLPDTVPSDEAPPDLEPWLAPLRAQYPPSTPLDDL